MNALPTFDEVLELPALYSVKVPAEWGDENGHMSMPFYLAAHNPAGFRQFHELGFDDAYIARERRNFFELEQHLRYLREVMISDELTAHVRLIARTDKVVHYMGLILNHRTREVSNVLEAIAAHVDLVTRRTVTLRPEEALWVDATLSRHRALDWEPPLGGYIRAGGQS